MRDDAVDRRRWMAAAAALSLLPASVARAAPASGDFTKRLADPREALETFVRIQGGNDGRTRFNWGTGTVYALRPGELAMPLFRAEAVQWIRFVPEGPGRYRRETAFVQFHYDLDGRFLEQWKNPLNGRVVPMPVFKNEFGTVVYTADRGVLVPAGMQVESAHAGQPFVRSWRVAGDVVWMISDDFVRYYSARSSGKVIENAVRTYQSSLSELADASRASVAFIGGETALVAWQPWMEMPTGAPGQMMWHFVSHKFERRDDLPAGIRAEVDRRQPKLWEHP